MKQTRNIGMVLMLTCILSSPIYAQVIRGTTSTPRRTTTISPRKSNTSTQRANRQNTVVTAKRGTPRGPQKALSLAKNKVWLFGKNNSKGRLSNKSINDIVAPKDGPYFYYDSITFGEFNSYELSSKLGGLELKKSSGLGMPKMRRKIPQKKFSIPGSIEDWDWIDMKKESTTNIVGVAGKANLHYFKNIKKNSLISFTSAFDHIIVTDTLYAPVAFLSAEREKRNYIKIIADCIVYEKPIRPASVSTRAKTDYVFSTANIIFKSKFENLQSGELSPPPPFVIADTNVEIHKDPFGKTDKKLLNRLYIEIMEQITTEMNGIDDPWEKDKLLTKFQQYKHKVQTDILFNDNNADEAGLLYEQKFNVLTNQFKAEIRNNVQNNNRTIGDLDILVEGDINTLHKIPFKYYAFPTIATLSPTMNDSTGVNNQLGSCFFKASGTSDLEIGLEVTLGYDENKFEEADQLLKEKGLSLEKNPPKSLLLFENQTLKINGKPLGEIIPISNQVFHLDITLPDQQLSLIKLFPQDNSTKFDLVGKMDNSIKEFRQIVALHVPNDLLTSLDYEHIIKRFNIVESNTFTDHVRISSQLFPTLEIEGALQYIEVSLEFLFDDINIYKGPFRLSSYSTLSSEKDIPFLKYSENYKISVTGTAYYEDGHRDIDNDFITDSKIIVLDEGMFKDDN